jgi:hypothetical protein
MKYPAKERPTLAGRHACGDTPFPSSIFHIYDVNDCWYFYWPHPSWALTVMVGVAPTTHQPVLIYNEANAPISIVRIATSSGTPRVRPPVNWGTVRRTV